MKTEEWEPHYQRILEFFGFSRDDDERAAKILSEILTKDSLPELKAMMNGQDCIVCGNAPSLKFEIKSTEFTDHVIIAADAAARVLFNAGIRPDIIVSDIDGMDDDFLEMNDLGTVLVLHAHGDNIPLVRSWVPKVRGRIVGTTQSSPLFNVHNFGGFSDGDRAVFMAHDCGANGVKLIGFDLDDPQVDPVKHGKLMIARDLLRLLGHDL